MRFINEGVRKDGEVLINGREELLYQFRQKIISLCRRDQRFFFGGGGNYTNLGDGLQEIRVCYFFPKLMAKWRWPRPVRAELVEVLGDLRYRRCQAKRERGERYFPHGEGPQSGCGKQGGIAYKVSR